jgi:murein DD-endopeptidase MepM/ murein hydrolase activator NlpD
MKLTPSRKLALRFCAAIIVLTTAVCSTGYITPGSMAATAQAEEKAPATAFYVEPTTTSVSTATATAVDPTATPFAVPTDTPEESPTPGSPILYSAQSGDSLRTVAMHFGVLPEEIASPANIPEGLLPPGQLMIVPDRLDVVSPSERIMPDSELVYSPSTIGFNAHETALQMGGYLGTYRQYIGTSWHSGGQAIEKVALENSINPRLLMSILEFQSGWVSGQPVSQFNQDNPIAYIDEHSEGLYAQMFWVMKQLSTGYYGWREGWITELTFPDGRVLRLSPELNAGSVAIQYLFSKLYLYEDWLQVIDRQNGYPALHTSLFPDPWVRAAEEEPLLPAGLAQPPLSLPFFGNQVWSFSSGPHGAWDPEGSLAALDFAPGSTIPGCVESDKWVTAASPGLVVRTGTGVVVLDLDGDGNEQTGWVVVYLHVDQDDLVRVGDWVELGARLGHPSCVGGHSTASHLHIARKYNGEWVEAAGPIPFNFSGWVAAYGGAPYKGYLVRDGVTLTACTCGNVDTVISRSANDPY